VTHIHHHSCTRLLIQCRAFPGHVHAWHGPLRCCCCCHQGIILRLRAHPRYSLHPFLLFLLFLLLLLLLCRCRLCAFKQGIHQHVQQGI
jgi:hypothetical protein